MKKSILEILKEGWSRENSSPQELYLNLFWMFIVVLMTTIVGAVLVKVFLYG